MRGTRFAALLLFALASCNGLPQAPQGGGPLPAPPPADDFINPTAAPFERSDGKAAFARTVAVMPGPGRTTVQIRDLIVGPHGEAQFAALRGPMVVDARSGTGSVSLGDRTLKLSRENPASIAAGARPVARNDGDTPLVLRLYVVEGR